MVPLFVVSAIIVLGCSGWGYWHSIRSNPERTLYGAIENNFRVKSLTRQVVQQNGPQKRELDVELSLSPEAVAHGHDNISQTGEVDASVKTESMSTPSEEFVRYTSIETTQKNAKGEGLDFKDLLGKWGRSSSEKTGQPGELYGESILGVVPTGNLGARDRQALMKTIRDNNVYKFDEATLSRSNENGRPTYVYDVTVTPTAYIQVLKQFGTMVGLKQLEGLDPSQYANAEPLTFKLTVDVWSQKFTGIEYAGGQRTERIGSYGLNHDVTLPKESIPVEELQAKLQAAQE